MRDIRWLRRCATIATLACSTSLGAQVQPGRLVTRLPGFDREVALDTLVYSRTNLDVPAIQVFAILRDVYATLKLPKITVDSLHGVAYNTQFSGSTQLAGERMSTYLRCGVGPSGENADYFRATMAIATYVESVSETKSRIGTGFAAGARDMGGSGKAPVACATTGLLEARIATMVKEKLSAR